MPLICPSCENELETLDYSADTTEYGSYDIEHDEYNLSEHGDTDNYSYECPECGHNISWSNIQRLKEEWEREYEENSNSLSNTLSNTIRQIGEERQNRQRNSNTAELIAREAINPHLNELPQEDQEKYVNNNIGQCDKCGNNIIIPNKGEWNPNHMPDEIRHCEKCGGNYEII